MKNPKLRKALVLALSAIMLVCISIGATVAYLTSDDSVTNTFTAGKLTITLDEAPTDEKGAVIAGDRRQANTYHLIPGHTYVKDPTVHVAANSDDCYVFVRVENGLAGDKGIEIKTETDGIKTIDAQIQANGWTKLTIAGVEGDLYYREHTKMDAEKDYVVFDKFMIATAVDNDDITAHKDAKVNVYAYAIQKDGMADASAAWAAGVKTKAEGGWASNATNP